MVLQDEEEQEDIVDDVSLMDIDSGDSGNPLAATEYVDEIYRFYRENEVIYWPSVSHNVYLHFVKTKQMLHFL